VTEARLRLAPLRAIRAAPWAGDGGRLTVDAADDMGVIFRVARAVSVECERLGAEGTRVRGTVADLKRLAGGLDAASAPPASLFWRFLEPVAAWRTKSRAIDLDRPVIMAILNLTDDSFSGDGIGSDETAAVRRAEELRDAGATIIDVGAESARADRPVRDAIAETRLVAPVVARLAAEGHTVSVDTYKPEVARAAVDAGAAIVNDISGLTAGLGAAEAASRGGAAYVLNYSYTVPKRRPDAPPLYLDVVDETLRWMFERVEMLRSIGLPRETIAVDPGIAFGKSHDEDLQVLRRLGEFTSLGLPLMLAHSRKNFLGGLTGRPPAERDLETHVASALAWTQGARIFRVHDVGGTRRALAVAAAIASANAGDFAPDGESWPWRAGASALHMTSGEADKDAPPGQRW
jgi:dihydropteroate synthase